MVVKSKNFEIFTWKTGLVIIQVLGYFFFTQKPNCANSGPCLPGCWSTAIWHKFSNFAVFESKLLKTEMDIWMQSKILSNCSRSAAAGYSFLTCANPGWCLRGCLIQACLDFWSQFRIYPVSSVWLLSFDKIFTIYWVHCSGQFELSKLWEFCQMKLVKLDNFWILIKSLGMPGDKSGFLSEGLNSMIRTIKVMQNVVLL